jgi:acid stress-induced BolA-like protein IbaG/YrbA
MRIVYITFCRRPKLKIKKQRQYYYLLEEYIMCTWSFHAHKLKMLTKHSKNMTQNFSTLLH